MCAGRLEHSLLKKAEINNAKTELLVSFFQGGRRTQKVAAQSKFRLKF